MLFFYIYYELFASDNYYNDYYNDYNIFFNYSKYSLCVAIVQDKCN